MIFQIIWRVLITIFILIGAFVVAAYLLAVAFSMLARAEPPPVDSPQYKLLEPYAPWVTRQTQPSNGMGCCNLADCRAVEARTDGTHYEAYIDKKVFVGGPDQWLTVPDDVILHDNAPDHPPFAVACWSAARISIDNGFYCFTAGVEY